MSFTLDPEVKRKFQEYCKAYDMAMSQRLETLMRNEYEAKQ